MKQKLRARRTAVAFMAVAVGAAFAMLGAASSSHATVAAHGFSPAVNGISGTPLLSGPQQVKPNVTFGCQSRPLDGSAGPRCYNAAQIQHAYNYSGLLASGVNGSGKTIVIVDAYGNPTIASDLQTFDSVMGLPDPNFTVITPAGSPPPFDVTDPNQFGWAVETTLDIEWAHVMAPGANIILDVAASNNDSDILAATKFVIDNHVGDVISQSFGEAEQCMDPSLVTEQHALFAKAAGQGQTLFASSGDSGAAQPACVGNGAVEAASTPASDPNVTGVGGTTLDADTSTGAYIGETAWTEPFGCNPPAVAPNDVNCSGGGFSTIYSRPAWQASQNKSAMRGVPDVAYNAGLAGGVLIHSATINVGVGLPANAPVFFIVGGTSCGSPQWAGLAADADQIAGGDMGSINKALYQIGQSSHALTQLHDITTGNNDVAEIGGAGFNAGPGWDPVTGLGSPNAGNLLPYLAKKG